MMPVKTFVQRGTLRDQIREQLCRGVSEDREGETKKVGIWGLGGAGKSQLARSYLQQYGQNYDAWFWIQAGDIASIDQDFLEIYQSLADGMLQPHQLTAESVRLAVLGYLQGRPKAKWLIVFDEADYLDRRDQKFVNLSRYIPGGPNTHVIITSRSSIARELSTFDGVEVGSLDIKEAVDLFFRCAKIQGSPSEEEAQAMLIVKELGYLALAIAGAGSYISQTPRLSSDLPRYLQEYRQQEHRLLQELPQELVDMYGHSVMTVWETSYLAVYDQAPEACFILTLLGFVNNEDIFLDLFDPQSGAGSAPQWEESWAKAIGMQDGVCIWDLERYLAILERYSLLQRKINENTNNHSYSMHRLVHTWSYNRLLMKNGLESNRFGLAALQLLYEATTKIRQNSSGTMDRGRARQDELRLVPHLSDGIQAIGRLPTNADDDAGMLDKIRLIGRFLDDIGSWRAASFVHKVVLEKAQRTLGDEHPETLTAMVNLGVSFQSQCKFDEAKTIFRKAIEKTTQSRISDQDPLAVNARHYLRLTLSREAEADTMWRHLKEVQESLRKSGISLTNQAKVLAESQSLVDSSEPISGEDLRMLQRSGVDHSAFDLSSHLQSLSEIRKNIGRISAERHEAADRMRRVENEILSVLKLDHISDAMPDVESFNNFRTMVDECFEELRQIVRVIIAVDLQGLVENSRVYRDQAREFRRLAEVRVSSWRKVLRVFEGMTSWRSKKHGEE